jgi:hypothetical protein
MTSLTLTEFSLHCQEDHNCFIKSIYEEEIKNDENSSYEFYGQVYYVVNPYVVGKNNVSISASSFFMGFSKFLWVLVN